MQKKRIGEKKKQKQELCALILQEGCTLARLARRGRLKALFPSWIHTSEGQLSQRMREQGPKPVSGPGREKGSLVGSFPASDQPPAPGQGSKAQAGHDKALCPDRVDDESASVYENLNIKSPKVSGMSNTGR